MSPQSILIGQIIVVFTTIILTTWYATQWVRFSLTMMLTSERDSRALAIINSMRLGSSFSGGINLMPMRLTYFQEADKFQLAVVSSVLSLLSYGSVWRGRSRKGAKYFRLVTLGHS